MKGLIIDTKRQILLYVGDITYIKVTLSYDNICGIINVSPSNDIIPSLNLFTIYIIFSYWASLNCNPCLPQVLTLVIDCYSEAWPSMKTTLSGCIAMTLHDMPTAKRWNITAIQLRAGTDGRKSVATCFIPT